MNQNDIITDRFLLLADCLQYAPALQGELLGALDEMQRETLLRLLETLTDRAEALFAPAQDTASPAVGGFEMDGDALICRECALFCRIGWDNAGAVTGARCALGRKAAAIAREQQSTSPLQAP